MTAVAAKEALLCWPSCEILDVAGAGLVTGGLSFVVLALSVGSVAGWGSEEFLLLISLAGALLGAFAVAESRLVSHCSGSSS